MPSINNICSSIKKLRKKVQHECRQNGFEHLYEDFVQEILAKRCEGFCEHQSVKQSVIDIARISSGRKGNPNYDTRIALSTTYQLESCHGIDGGAGCSDTERNIDVERILRLVECKNAKRIFELIFKKGYLYKEAGIEIGISEGRISQIVSNHMSKIKEKLYNDIFILN